MKPIHCRISYFTEYIRTTVCSTMIRKIMQIFALKRVKKKQCRIVYYAILIYYAMWFVEMNGRMAGAYPLSYDISYCLQLRPGASTKINYFPPNR